MRNKEIIQIVHDLLELPIMLLAKVILGHTSRSQPLVCQWHSSELETKFPFHLLTYISTCHILHNAAGCLPFTIISLLQAMEANFDSYFSKVINNFTYHYQSIIIPSRGANQREFLPRLIGCPGKTEHCILCPCIVTDTKRKSMVWEKD